jgi:hypothetical protein
MATSITDYSYGELTNYRNSFADEHGYVGKFTRVALECGYLGLVPVGALETLVHAVYALAVKGVSFLGCFIPFQCMMPHLTNIDTYFDQVAKVRLISSATATTASALGVASSLWTSGSLDAGAQALAVKKYADKCLVGDMLGPHKKYANPFSLAVLKAITRWRNDFIDQETGKVVTTTKIFKQLSAVPLYLGVAALAAFETLARAVYAVAVWTLTIGLYCPAVLAIPPLWLLRKSCLSNWFSLAPLARAFSQHVTILGAHAIGATPSPGYAFGVMGAALLSLKDNFMKSTPLAFAEKENFNYSNRVYGQGQIDHKSQIDFALRIALGCVLTPAFAIGGPIFSVGYAAWNVLALPLIAVAQGIYNAGATAIQVIYDMGKVLWEGLDKLIDDLVEGTIQAGEAIVEGLYDLGKWAIYICLGVLGSALFLLVQMGVSVIECFTPSTYY